MEIDEWLTAEVEPSRLPDREPGIDDDLQDGETWAQWCRRLVRRLSGEPKWMKGEQ